MAITADQVDADREDQVHEPDKVELAADFSGSPQRESSPRSIWAIALLAAAVLILGGVSVKLGMDVRGNALDDDRDGAALAAANRIAVQLVTLNHTSANQNLQAIATDSTGPFRDQWDKISKNFASVLENGKVDSTGEVKESGLVDIDDAHATVLTAVTSTVKNTEAPEGQQRVYRMKMTLDHSDGRWLVSNVEFVA
ncbi:hypothetical protein ACFVAV_33870 [Nocardia sp. NPDC057663]|uniref:hypothetical protein n=1 Tax=Nocardia sp. NPDC057663 TaxID=3346201 RepID=UPI00366F282B